MEWKFRSCWRQTLILLCKLLKSLPMLRCPWFHEHVYRPWSQQIQSVPWYDALQINGDSCILSNSYSKTKCRVCNFPRSHSKICCLLWTNVPHTLNLSSSTEEKLKRSHHEHELLSWSNRWAAWRVHKAPHSSQCSSPRIVHLPQMLLSKQISEEANSMINISLLVWTNQHCKPFMCSRIEKTTPVRFSRLQI